MNLPGHLTGKTATDRKRAKDQIRKSAARERRTIGGRQPPIGRKPVHLVVILGVMLVIGGMYLVSTQQQNHSTLTRTKAEVCMDELCTLRIAIERFQEDCGGYPSISTGITNLIVNPGKKNWQGPYVSLLKNDPWGKAYVYGLNSNTVILMSMGPDGIRDTGDDFFSEDWELHTSLK
jgi:type II secretion system protein G